VALRDTARTHDEQIDKLEASIASLRDITRAQGKQIIEQGERIREDLRQIKQAVSEAGAPSPPG
jgi:hypothetical protein